MIVVARCSRCHGWTMYHADSDSFTARQWTAQARAGGDLITTYEPSEQLTLGEPCPDADGKKPSERHCPIKWTDSAWSPYA